MRFAFVITNLNGGGAEKAIVNIARHLLQAGHEVRLIAFEERADYVLPAGLSVEYLYPGRSEVTKGWLGKRLLARRLNAVLADWQADLLVSTLPFADEVAALAKLPRHCCRIANTLSAEIARLALSSPSKAKRRLARYRAVYGQRPLIAVSQGVALDLQTKLGLDSMIEVIRNPFDQMAIHQAAHAACPELPKRPYVIHVGRFSGQKRHDVLLDAWQQVDFDGQLVLLAHAEPKLTYLIEQRGMADRVIVAGFQNNPYPWIAGAQLLVLCSDHEGLPNVLVEALMCGTPVISTDCPSGPSEILQDGLPQALVPCGDAAALAKKMNDFLVTPPDITGINLERFGVQCAVQAYERLAGHMRRAA